MDIMAHELKHEVQLKGHGRNGFHQIENGNGIIKNRRRPGKETPFCSIKHFFHCLLMLSLMGISVAVFLNWNSNESSLWVTLGTWPVYVLYVLRILALIMALPYEIFVFIGLFFYDTFPGDVELNQKDMSSYPFICFRVATRGLSQKLVRKTISRNLKLLQQSGLLDFKLQVLTDILVPGIIDDVRVSQMVVPAEYATKTGALYKAKSLQYAIEHGERALPFDFLAAVNLIFDSLAI